jgi:uncharacterized membrane protein YkgB
MPGSSSSGAWLDAFDARMRSFMVHWGVLALRAALGVVFLWFGVLKLVDETPISSLLEEAYPFLPHPEFQYVLGAWEVAIGIGLLLPLLPIGSDRAGVVTRVTLALLWAQMLGTFSAVVLAPRRIFDGYPPLLTLEGEFIAKNLVLITAGLAIGATVHPPGEPAPVAGTIEESLGKTPIAGESQRTVK